MNDDPATLRQMAHWRCFGVGVPMKPEESDMAETAMKHAMVLAGFQTPEERLDRIAEEAWRKWSTADGGGARRDYMTERMRGDITWAAVERWQPGVMVQVIGSVLNRAKQAIEDARPNRARDAGVKPAGGGHGKDDTQSRRAPALPSRDHARPVAGRGSEPADHTPSPTEQAPAHSNLTHLADRQAAAAEARARTEIRLSRLDTVLIGGKPVGDCTVSEVRDWATARARDARDAGRDARFALSLVANLPSGERIRDWWLSGDEVDALYAKAEAEHAA